MFKRLIATLLCLTFSFSNLQYAPAQSILPTGAFSINQLPQPGTMVWLSTPFVPLTLKGLIIDPQKPLEFQFIVDTGRGPQDTASVKTQANQLIKYFLAGLTIPEGDLWVNLSPYEKDRIVPAVLGQTDLGRDLLAQDYVLKQLTASLIYPEKNLGKEFWDKIYEEAQARFGTTNVPVNTFNKVWILPDQSEVFENNNAAYITKSTLKVMLDEDYRALKKHRLAFDLPSLNTHSLASQIVREIILPEIQREVNTGKNFALLRQIYQALILAKWYKEAIQNGLLNAIYTNKQKIAGINLSDPGVKEEIYQRYLKAYKKGTFNYIKEEPLPDGELVPRKYFSGGIPLINIHLVRAHTFDARGPDGAMLSVKVAVTAIGLSAVRGAARLRRALSSAQPALRVPNKKTVEEFRGQLRQWYPAIEDDKLSNYIDSLKRQLLNMATPQHAVFLLDRDNPQSVQWQVEYGALKNEDWMVHKVITEPSSGRYYIKYKNQQDQTILIEISKDKTGQYKKGDIIPHIKLYDFAMSVSRPYSRRPVLQQRTPATLQPAKNGGIDLNQININRAAGTMANMQFSPAQITSLTQGGFAGFAPVIINITRIQSPLPLLGLKPSTQGAMTSQETGASGLV